LFKNIIRNFQFALRLVQLSLRQHVDVIRATFLIAGSGFLPRRI